MMAKPWAKATATIPFEGRHPPPTTAAAPAADGRRTRGVPMKLRKEFLM